ncbi:MAG: CHASE domain-containing protein [Alphaproteobacteria bacterium]|nr:CHASE domain-containing protein [Alphaproteobacteria bacterium]
MSPQFDNSIEKLNNENKDLQKNAGLHWYHWLIIIASTCLTLYASHITKQQSENNAFSIFQDQAQKVIEQVEERMGKYEMALHSGVAIIKANNNSTNYSDWKKYSTNFKIEEKYPGINGIGVIYNVPKDKLSEYLLKEREQRPDYKIHPQHDEDEYWPITYVEPEETNLKAIGLDMAHETNRYNAIKKARDTATPQVTGPITLVQDKQKTPGFLFYIPFYTSSDIPPSLEERRDKIIGAVYAPFIFDKLIKGTLREDARSVSIKISDDDVMLYSEIENFMSQPKFSTREVVEIYGRKWTFDIVTNNKFDVYTNSKKPYIVLLIGLFIEALLITIFIVLARSNKKAVAFANKMTESYRKKTILLETANEELEEFAYRTSHDLRSPILSTQSLIEMITEELDDFKNKEEVIRKCLSHAATSLEKLSTLIDDILNITKATYADDETTKINIANEINQTLLSINNLDGYSRISIQNNVPDDLNITTKANAFRAVINNLISNAVKYQDEAKESSYLKIYYTQTKESLLLHFEDNGLGIPKDQQEKIFQMFKRFHPKQSFGSGLGLYIVQKSCRRMNAEISYHDTGQGSLFTLELPLNA